MLYKQLQRVSQLDQQIHDMHLRLAEYYRERSELMGSTAAPAPSTFSPAIVRSMTPKNLYSELQATWKTLGVTIPTYKTLSKRLTGAIATMDQLIRSNPQLEHNLHVVLVPTQKQLDPLMSERYAFTDDYEANIFKRSTAWGVLVVTSPDFSLSVDSLSDSLGKDEFRYKHYDCRGLGVREAIAADLQGIEVVTDNNWTLLLKDAKGADYVPCVTRQDNQLIFEIDDTRCLLGHNYVQPAIAIT